MKRQLTNMAISSSSSFLLIINCSIIVSSAFISTTYRTLIRNNIQTIIPSRTESNDNHWGIRYHNSIKNILSLSNVDFDDFSSEEVQAANELTKEFYQQIKLRQDLSTKDDNNDNINSNTNNDIKETYEIRNNTKSSSTSSLSKKRKFTGRFSQGDLDSTGTPSAGLFATQNGTVYAVPAKQKQIISSTTTTSTSSSRSMTTKDKIMTQEFNLVSIASNEFTLILQGLVVSITLCFAIYIGLAGGITDGSERFGGYEDDNGDFAAAAAAVVVVDDLTMDNDMSSISNYNMFNNMKDESSITSMIENGIEKKQESTLSSSVWL